MFLLGLPWFWLFCRSHHYSSWWFFVWYCLQCTWLFMFWYPIQKFKCRPHLHRTSSQNALCAKCRISFDRSSVWVCIQKQSRPVVLNLLEILNQSPWFCDWCFQCENKKDPRHLTRTIRLFCINWIFSGNEQMEERILNTQFQAKTPEEDKRGEIWRPFCFWWTQTYELQSNVLPVGKRNGTPAMYCLSFSGKQARNICFSCCFKDVLVAVATLYFSQHDSETANLVMYIIGQCRLPQNDQPQPRLWFWCHCTCGHEFWWPSLSVNGRQKKKNS